MAHRLGIAEKVTFVPWMEQADLFDLYNEYDLFLFPSLHDSGGLVVLEALCRGLPVVCLDLGGPKEVVDETCGVVVATTKLNSAQVAQDLAKAVLSVLCDRERWRGLSGGAIARARTFLWQERVARFYHSVEPYLSRLPQDRDRVFELQDAELEQSSRSIGEYAFQKRPELIPQKDIQENEVENDAARNKKDEVRHLV